jgi:hypothetical protein
MQLPSCQLRASAQSRSVEQCHFAEQSIVTCLSNLRCSMLLSLGRGVCSLLRIIIAVL